jgi:hypothetical protein
MAMLIVDNAVELALKSYLTLHRRQRGGPDVTLEPDPRFVALLDGFEECFDEWPGALRRADLLWLHDVRNLLHHRGNGLTPDVKALNNYLEAAEVLLRFLFGDGPVDQARAAEGLQAPDFPETSMTPDIIVSIDSMIGRIKARQEHLPSDAAPSLALPKDDLLRLSRRASELLLEYGPELSDEEQEQLEPYLDWDSDIDGLPSSPEETIRVLERLRFAIAMILL